MSSTTSTEDMGPTGTNTASIPRSMGNTPNTRTNMIRSMRANTEYKVQAKVIKIFTIKKPHNMEPL